MERTESIHPTQAEKGLSGPLTSEMCIAEWGRAKAAGRGVQKEERLEGVNAAVLVRVRRSASELIVSSPTVP